MNEHQQSIYTLGGVSKQTFGTDWNSMLMPVISVEVKWSGCLDVRHCKESKEVYGNSQILTSSNITDARCFQKAPYVLSSTY